MKTGLHYKYILMAFAVVLLSLLIVTTVSGSSKSYHGITTVTYTNSITDSGGWGWNGGYSDSTNPSILMDQFGVSYWSTWDSCNWVQDLDTIYSRSNMYQNNVSIVGDGMARLKIQCPQGQVLRGHDYVQHWWQDDGYDGDGGTLDTSLVLSNP